MDEELQRGEGVLESDEAVQGGFQYSKAVQKRANSRPALAKFAWYDIIGLILPIRYAKGCGFLHMELDFRRETRL